MTPDTPDLSSRPIDEDLERVLGPRLIRTADAARFLGNWHPRSFREECRRRGYQIIEIMGQCCVKATDLKKFYEQ